MAKTQKGSSKASRSLQSIDLSDVGKEYSLIGFNILSHGNSIRAPSERDSSERQIPPVVNIAIALTLEACKYGRGMFLWQPKMRHGKRTDSSRWHSIPDVLLCDMVWSDEQKTRFKEAPYTEQREYLNANGRLQLDDIVLPFVLHFPGRSQLDPEDARVTACLDGIHPPLCAISIPGRAYIGWVTDILPNPDDKSDYRNRYRHANKDLYSEYLFSKENKRDMKVSNVNKMYIAAISMYEHPLPHALMYFRGVTEMVQDAEKEGSDGVGDNDEDGDQDGDSNEEVEDDDDGDDGDGGDGDDDDDINRAPKE